MQTHSDLSGGDYIAVLYSQRRLIAAIIFVFLALAFAARFIIPEQYRKEVVVGEVATPSDNNLQTNVRWSTLRA